MILDLLRAEDVEPNGGLHRRVLDDRRFERQKRRFHHQEKTTSIKTENG